ncbi:hypothetical protein LRP31_01000 [Mesorhizobium mediterraneum]|uniref:Uncharacterized protein n=1 Tax=Mesorhizobium mediterraneum TaxID=43617 RepID=A0AAX3XKZ7_9HYPH|nr:hypothetical protein [Mesorhizobium mediterraneum]PAQ00656.1 hypothetical protein CIT25_19095 [Mesorhizobium mediterraneum]WIW52351.1 hypothetical protein LRP31_25365 [Mesorhizobium mediterraneum]WIW53868.1 hypothetical protein LRP31_01000 [Mesorhizobium mediterraneum]
MHNLYLAYDLITPGQKYEAVQNRIKQLGRWYKHQYSLYYVQSSLTAEQAHNFVRGVMDTNDKLVVIEAKNACVNGVPAAELAQLQTLFKAA